MEELAREDVLPYLHAKGYADGNILSGRHGQVDLEGGALPELYFAEETIWVDQDLESLFPVQPPSFMIRREWPQRVPDFPNPNLSDDEIGQAYSGVAQMSRPSDGSTWRQHVAATHRFLCRSITRAQLTSYDLTAVTHIISRGIDRAVAFLPFEITIKPSASHDDYSAIRNALHQRKHYLPLDHELIYGKYGASFLPDILHRIVWNRRFLAGCLHFTNHWGAFIWDRLQGEIYLFDPMEDGRIKRLDQALRFWRQTFYLMNYPYNFRFMLVPCTAQQGDWECGYLALQFLHHTLRGHVGENAKELISEAREKYGFRLTKWNNLGEGDEGQYHLYIRDWAILDHQNPTNVRYGDLIVRTGQLLQSMAANELGLKNQSTANAGNVQTLSRWLHWDLEPFVKRVKSPGSDLSVIRWRTLTPMGGMCPTMINGIKTWGFCNVKRLIKAHSRDYEDLVLPWEELPRPPAPDRNMVWTPAIPPFVREARNERMDTEEPPLSKTRLPAQKPLDPKPVFTPPTPVPQQRPLGSTELTSTTLVPASRQILPVPPPSTTNIRPHSAFFTELQRNSVARQQGTTQRHSLFSPPAPSPAQLPQPAPVRQPQPGLSRQQTPDRSSRASSVLSAAPSTTSVPEALQAFEQGLPVPANAPWRRHERFLLDRGVAGESLSGKNFKYDEGLQEAGKDTTINLMRRLGDIFPHRPVVPKVHEGRSYTSLVPPGLMPPTSWIRIAERVREERDPQTPKRASRAERQARRERERRKDEEEDEDDDDAAWTPSGSSRTPKLSREMKGLRML